MDEIILQHLPYVKSLAWRYGKYHRDDIYSDGVLALVRAARAYNPRYGAKFFSYAKHRIDGQILDYLSRVANRKPHIELNESVVSQLLDDKEIEPVYLACKNELADIVLTVLAKLKVRHQIVMRGLLAQKTQVEIANDIQCTPARIAQIKQEAFIEIRKHLAKTYESAYL